MTTPLLSVGVFGVHLIDNSAGMWSFAGSIPVGIKQGGYATESDGIAAFVAWFKNQSLDFQREHVGNLRNDVFAAFMSA